MSSHGSDFYQNIYAGKLILSELGPSAVELKQRALCLIHENFGDNPESLESSSFQRILGDLRSRLAQPEIKALAALSLIESGLDPATVKIDSVRLRAVSPGLEKVKAAEAVFFHHRDTWYGNPSCQVNVWLPLLNATKSNSFRFYLDHFTQAVTNDSVGFRTEDFRTQGGFGRVDGPGKSVYPKALEQPEGEYWDALVPQSKMLFFSASHLHQTKVNRSSKVRFSLDFRFFNEEHLKAGIGAPDPDNLSQGLLIEDYTFCR